MFTILGCQLAQQLNLPSIVVIFSGMITGCAGGVMRDILCNDIPLIFQKEIYASASLVTGCVYLLVFYFFGNEFYYATSAAFFTGLAIRLLAVHYDWALPKFIYRDKK